MAGAPAGAWPMWGGGPDRNLVSDERNLPAAWDVKAGKNLAWKAQLGSQTFGNPVVGGGKVFIGTNNGHPRDPAIKGDKGVLMCFAEADGAFLWQAVHDKLAGGDKEDWSDIGITSTPCVVGDRVYYVSNRDELICADTEGFRDGTNDGPVADEARTSPTDVDVVWKLDMIAALGVTPLFASASAPLVVGDRVFVVTGQGTDEETGKVRKPEVPSFVAVNRETGKVVWSSNAPGGQILAGQWSSPAYAVVKGEPQIVFPGGDGWVYAFKPASGELLWKFDCRVQLRARAAAGEDPEDLHVMAAPVFYRDRVIVTIGKDPEQGDGEGCLRVIDATQRGDVTRTAEVWRLDGKEFGRSVSTVAIRDELLYAVEVGGFLNCIDVNSGKRFWRHDLKAGVWGSPVVADSKVYLANDDGKVLVFRHAKTPQPPVVNELPGSTKGTAAVAHQTIFISDRSQLYAIRAK